MPRLRAKNPHHLMRCLECRNIMDLTEAHLLACLERKESRGDFTRFDYPDKDPAMDGLLIYQKLENGNTVFDKRKVKPLNMDLREGR
jgi:succinate dehydrogenase/fumarate reductase flavoprotein subunit